jgi:Tol biopolymer transport system component
MSLAPGTRFGVYEVESLLGAGGMGEVHRARDTKLGRPVAIKILPPHLAGDPERIARFEREARALAALNHPRIATLYGLEEYDGRHLLIMELVEGDTLAERLQPGPLRVEAVVGIGLQIADALEAAHEKGIVHRDLKPANIKVTADEAVKVLDFGLAKALDAPAAANVTQSPTLSMMATQAGVILGTAAYMSPEQARGLAADHRSDIFSFGVVLFEMLSGRQPFQGETAPDILASILARDPDLTALPADLNPRLRDLVRRCLDKHPKRRWQAIGDVRAELEMIAVAPKAEGSESPAAVATSRWKQAAVVLGSALVGGALTAYGAWALKPAAPPPPPVITFSLNLPATQQFTNPGRRLLAISPDGQQTVYVANRQLFLRRMSEREATPIRGTETQLETGNRLQGLTSPVFSPDAQFVAYYVVAEGVLKKVPTTGGTPTTICAAANPLGMSWHESGILFSQDGAGIMRVAPDGGQPETLVTTKSGEVPRDPQLLPDGTSLLFAVTDNAGEKPVVVVQSLRSGERKTLLENAAAGQYLPSGHLVFFRGGALFAAPFDAQKNVLTAAAVPVLEGVRRNDGVGSGAQFAVSSSGSLVYIPGAALSATNQRRIVMLATKGAREPLAVPLAAYNAPRISPDGRWLAVGTDDGDIWLYDLAGGNAIRRLTLDAHNRFPAWTADSSRVTFQSEREGDAGMFWQRIDGGVAERLTRSEQGAAHVPESWSPDGKTLLFAVARDGVFSLHTYSRSNQQTAPFGGLDNVYLPSSTFSPDGQWVAYYHRPPRSATGSLIVQSFSNPATKHEVYKGGGIHPFWWEGRGRLQLFYRLPSRVESVQITLSPAFGFSKPAELVWSPMFVDGPDIPRKMDVMPDGERFIVVDRAVPSDSDTADRETIQVVLNWVEELKRRLPAR